MIVHQLFVCGLAFLVLEDALANYRSHWSVVFALGLVVVFATLYRFWLPAQMFLTMAALAPVLFLAVFFTKAHLESMSVSPPQGVAAPVVKSDTPGGACRLRRVCAQFAADRRRQDRPCPLSELCGLCRHVDVVPQRDHRLRRHGPGCPGNLDRSVATFRPATDCRGPSRKRVHATRRQLSGARVPGRRAALPDEPLCKCVTPSWRASETGAVRREDDEHAPQASVARGLALAGRRGSSLSFLHRAE